MRVLSDPSTKGWTKETECGRCETRVELSIDDFSRTVSDQRDGDAAVYVCPTCGADQWVSMALIPKHLHHRLPR